MSYDLLLPLIKKTKSTLSLQEFQERINVVFHNYEANKYDEMHNDMKESLQEQTDLLFDDLLYNKQSLMNNLSLLDIGCGTGMSTEMVLNSKMGSFIEKVTLLDSSPNMLNYAEQKAKKWNKNYTIINGYVADLNQKYDIIIICSVLHHIPDLTLFIKQVDNLLASGGILIHLQDPNADFAYDPKYIQRINEYNTQGKVTSKNKKITDIIPKKWKHFINRKLGRKTYIDLINDELIAEKVIKKRMSADEIWSVTDIHIESNLNKKSKGISFHFLKTQLTNYTLINQRSYGFYGILKSELEEKFKTNESQFISQNELNGRNISGIWIKN